MKYISTLILFILLSFISNAQNSKNIPKIYHKKLLNSIAGRYANVDVTMGYAKGTGGIIIGNPNQSEYARFNDFSFSINVLRGKDQQFGSITNITAESNNLNDLLIRFDWKNKRTDQGTISGEIQLFYSSSKDRYETYFINNSSSIFKIFWWTELDQSQKDSLNSIIDILNIKEPSNPIIGKTSVYTKNFNSIDIIGKPIKIGNLEVAQNDFPNVMNWDDAIKACQSLGNGWRLPNKDELNLLYQNKYKIGGFATLYYWSSTEYDGYNAWRQFFNFGRQDFYSKNFKFNVRAVRAF